MRRRPLTLAVLAALAGAKGRAAPAAVAGQVGRPGPAAPPAAATPAPVQRFAAALARAHQLREQAVQAGDQPYGAVVVDAQQRIVGEAPSRVIALRDPDAHAERQALLDAQTRLRRPDLTGLVLVSSSRPCARCEAAAARAGIARMVFGSGVDGGVPRGEGPSAGGGQGVALVEAAARGETAEVRRLLRQGAALDAVDARQRTALLAAVAGGHDDLAVWLVEQGADINHQDDQQDSAFLLAGARGRTAVLRAMLLPPSGHADRPDLTRRNRYGGSALIPACHHGHVETVRLLLQASRIDVDLVNHLGWTALLEAVILGDGGARHAEIVRLLLAHGADPRRADAHGVTPLAHARQRGQGAIVALLVAAGG